MYFRSVRSVKNVTIEIERVYVKWFRSVFVPFSFRSFRLGKSMNTKAWKDSFKASAVSALREAADDTLTQARKLLADLEKSGLRASLNEAGDGLLVGPPPVPDKFAERIRQHKAELVELLKSGGAEIWRWQPEDLLIRVSLAQSSVTDFILAPPVSELQHSAIKPEIQKALLEGASAEWRAAVKKLGGLCAYPASAADAVKAALAAKKSAPKEKQTV